MSELIEVKISNYTLLLPLFPNSTVATIAQAALMEYKSFHIQQKGPSKILFVRDGHGRILSSSLPLPLPTNSTTTNTTNTNNISDAIVSNTKPSASSSSSSTFQMIEVVLEDYQQSDLILIKDIQEVYREWQKWTIQQLFRFIQRLSQQDDDNDNNNGNGNNANVSLKLDNTFFPFLHELTLSQDEEIQQACLIIYRKLLTRFPQKDVIIHAADEIARIFMTTKYASIALYALQSFQSLSPLQLKVFEGLDWIKQLLIPPIEGHLLRFPSETQGEILLAFQYIIGLFPLEEQNELIRILEKCRERCQQQQQKTNEPSPTAGTGGAIEDKKIRLYALEKARKLLEYQEEVEKEEEGGGGAAGGGGGAQFSFANEQEVVSILQGLFAALKNSIQARPKENKEQTTTTGGGAGGGGGGGGAGLASVSTAGRLIQQGLSSPESDLEAVCLSLDCLKAIVFFPQDVSSLVSEALRSAASLIPRHRYRVNGLTGKRLTNIQKIFIIIAKESYRLLFTLSHAAEGRVTGIGGGGGGGGGGGNGAGGSLLEGKWIDIAEKAALLFSLTVVYGMPRGWSNCVLRLESGSLQLSVAVQSPNYRLFMALSYLSHQARKVEVRTRRDASEVLATPSWHGGGGREGEEESTAIASLRDLLSGNKFALLKSLWWWAIGEKSNFLIRRYALNCIAPASVISSIGLFLWKLDPVPRLLEVLTRSCRMACSSYRPTFLQIDKRVFRQFDISLDQPADREDHISDSYSDTDYSSGEDEEEDDENNNNEEGEDEEEVRERMLDIPEETASPYGGGGGDGDEVKLFTSRVKRGKRHHGRRSYERRREVKVDHKVVRLALKTLANLLQQPGAPFNADHRNQLKAYLEHLEIGQDPEGGLQGLALREVVEHDRISAFYYNILIS
eukprot:gene8154-8996_t